MELTVKRVETKTVQIEVKEGFYFLKSNGGWEKAMVYNGGEFAMLVCISDPKTPVSTQVSISYLSSLMTAYEIEKEISKSEFMHFMHSATEQFTKFFPES